VGALFFEDTITAENYPDILTQFIALLEENERDCWLQQDRATTHYTKTTAALYRTFSVFALSDIVFSHHNHQTCVTCLISVRISLKKNLQP
jgi:hypothetical protein